MLATQQGILHAVAFAIAFQLKSKAGVLMLVQTTQQGISVNIARRSICDAFKVL